MKPLKIGDFQGPTLNLPESPVPPSPPWNVLVANGLQQGDGHLRQARIGAEGVFPPPARRMAALGQPSVPLKTPASCHERRIMMGPQPLMEISFLRVARKIFFWPKTGESMISRGLFGNHWFLSPNMTFIPQMFPGTKVQIFIPELKNMNVACCLEVIPKWHWKYSKAHI